MRGEEASAVDPMRPRLGAHGIVGRFARVLFGPFERRREYALASHLAPNSDSAFGAYRSGAGLGRCILEGKLEGADTPRDA
jgi:hypothetical protein